MKQTYSGAKGGLMAVLSCWCFAVCLNVSHAPAQTPKPKIEWQVGKPQKLFDKKNLTGWRVVGKYEFKRHGKVDLAAAEVVLGKGRPATGIAWQGEFPLINYEITIEAKRVAGDDFFCGMTFPIRKSHCTLIIGGWGGGVTGISNVDGMSAVENETTGYTEFKENRWYKIRLKVTEQAIEAWIDKEKIVDLQIKDRKFAVWWEQEPARPFGIVSWNTKAALRNLVVTKIEPGPKRKSDKPPKE